MQARPYRRVLLFLSYEASRIVDDARRDYRRVIHPASNSLFWPENIFEDRTFILIDPPS
jgi:hypothetical protein